MRFIAKAVQTGRHTVWNVYDTERACYPVQVPGFGRVGGGYDNQTQAQTEAERLAAFCEQVTG